MAATMDNFELLADGTVRPWLALERHLLLRALWEHRPSGLFHGLGRRCCCWRTAAPRARVQWFSPADHDVHVQQPRAVAEAMHTAVEDGS